MKEVASIVHPLFLEFTSHVRDDYWKLLYEDMAFGKFPGGVYVQKDYFCCFHKGKEFSVPLHSTDIFTLFTQIHSLLNSKMGIQSEDEKRQMKAKLMGASKEETPKRLIKDSTLTSFVLREGARAHLSDHVLRKVFSLFIIGFMFKTILVKDVIFNGVEIQGIHGFHFSNRRIKIDRNVLELKKGQVFLETNRSDRNTLSSSWSKYLQSLSALTSPIPHG